MNSFAFWLGVVAFGVCAWISLISIFIYLVRLFGEDDISGDGGSV